MGNPSASDILLKALGVLLLTAAVLKGHELLTVPMANNDLWSWRPFLIFQVEFELAWGLWLVSGLFKRLAWLAGVLCFALFCCITLYKGLTGAASCGGFGTVHVSPWVTLLTIDLPAVVALGLFRPRTPFAPLLSFLRGLPEIVTGRWDANRSAVGDLAGPLPSLRRFAATAFLGLLVLTTTTPILALNEPAVVTSTYEVLEPETWVGKKLPILEHIDIADQLRTGTWLILFYHHDCPDCRKAIPKYEQMARDLEGTKDLLQIALIEVPPYGQDPASGDSPCTLGRLADVKEWFVTTPATTLLAEANVKAAWEPGAPDLATVLSRIAGNAPTQSELWDQHQWEILRHAKGGECHVDQPAR